jgi:hypothetical protein
VKTVDIRKKCERKWECTVLQVKILEGLGSQSFHQFNGPVWGLARIFIDDLREQVSG